MNAKEISRLALYVAGGLLGLYLIYYGLVVEKSVETVAIGAALAGVDIIAALNIDGVKNTRPGDIPEPEGGDDVVVHGFNDSTDGGGIDLIEEGGEADYGVEDEENMIDPEEPGKYGDYGNNE